MKLVRYLVLSAALAGAAVNAEEARVTVRHSASISTAQIQNGDRVEGKAISPENLRGNTILNGLTPKLASPTFMASAAVPESAKGVSESAGKKDAPSASSAGDQPDLKAVNIDFIPGEKTIFYDDFSDMDQDEPPPHWKLRDGKVELREGGNVRQLTTVCPAMLSLSSEAFTFPKNFTTEVEVEFTDDQSGMDFFAWPKGVDGGEAASWRMTISAAGISMKGPEDEDIGSENFPEPIVNKPIKFALWVQNGRARGYVNGKRFGDVNQMFVPANVKPAQQWTIRQRCDRPGEKPDSSWMGIRSFRVAESTPDFSSTISSTGKYVTHGILFDTDSDRLKPESAAVLKSVAHGLSKNPNLKLEIDGFTDSVGDAAHNLDLSKRRAEAVRSVLISQFNVDGARLTSNGFGAAKPVASNDTPDGRAQNRRVEFVRR